MSTTAHTKGFTLVEMMVSVALFSVVMLVAAGALLSVINTNRKAQSLKSVVNNLNFVMETMTRTIRVGTTYYCGENPASGQTDDCPTSGMPSFTFEPVGGSASLDDQITYRHKDGRIERSIDGGSSFAPITAPEVTIDKLEFFVEGSSPSDNLQPRVLVIVRGRAGVVGSRTETSFDLQTLITQRAFDD